MMINNPLPEQEDDISEVLEITTYEVMWHLQSLLIFKSVSKVFNNLDDIILSVSLFELNGMMLILACLMLVSPADGERPEAVADEKHPTGVWNGDTVAARRGRCVRAAFLSGLRQIKIRNHILSVGYISGTSLPGSSSVWTEEMDRLYQTSSKKRKNSSNVFDGELCYYVFLHDGVGMYCTSTIKNFSKAHD